MKHGNLKSFAMGVLVTVMVMGLALPAAASVGSKTAELFYNNIKIRLNGTELTPKDATGKEVEPFVIDGTTYLPVRAVGEALGLNVGWDGKTSTVILGNDAEYNQPAAWLGDLNTLTGYASSRTVTNGAYDADCVANNGEKFDRILSADGNKKELSYALNGQYKRFTGTVYLPESHKNDAGKFRFVVVADGSTAYTSPEIEPGTLPVAFDVNISNCLKLEIIWQYLSDSTWSSMDKWRPIYLKIGNAALWTE